MSGQLPTYPGSLSAASRLRLRMHQRSLRDDQRQIQFYYMLKRRIMNRIGMELSMGTALILLSLGIRFISRKVTDAFGFLMLRTLFWFCFVTILGIIFLIILQAARLEALSVNIRSAWNELMRRQMQQMERYSMASYNRAVTRINPTRTAQRIRSLLQALSRDLTTPESRNRYGSFLRSQTDNCFQVHNPDGRNAVLDHTGDDFLSENGDSSTASDFQAKYSRSYCDFETFMNALAQVGQCRQREIIPQSHRQLINRYETELIQKINENLSGEWFLITNHEEFFVFIRDNWNIWFPQRGSCPARQ